MFELIEACMQLLQWNQADMQADRPAGRQTCKQADKQTNKEKMTGTAIMMTAMTMPSPPSSRSPSDDHLFCHPHHLVLVITPVT